MVFLFFQVLKQLPDKEEKVESCSMSEKQQILYQNLFKKLKSSTNGESKPGLLLLIVHHILFSTNNKNVGS